LDRVTTALQNSEAELDQERSTSGGSAPLAPTSSAPVPAASGSASTSVTRLSEELRQARRDLASLQAARNVSTARVVQLEGDNRQLRDEISQLNQGQATSATENSDLRARLTDARRDICALEAQLSDVQDAYAGLRRVNDESEEGLEDVSTALSRVVEWIHLRHAAGAATPSSSAAEVATPSSSAAGAATPSSSAAGAAAPLSSTSTTPTGKRARDRSASPTLGPSPLKRAGSVSSQLPPSRSRSPSPALSLSSDEEIDQGPGGPGVLAPQEVIEIHDDGAGSESDHAGPEADQAPPVGGQAGSGTPPGSGGSPEYGSPPKGGNVEESEEEEEEDESDPEALAALARSRSEARRRPPVSTPRSKDPSPPPTTPRRRSPSAESSHSRSSTPGPGSIPRSPPASPSPPSSPAGSPPGSPPGPPGSPQGGALAPPLFPIATSIPGFNAPRNLTQAETDPWPAILLSQWQITALILSSLSRDLVIPSGWLFPEHIRGTRKPVPGVGYRDDLITGANIQALINSRPWTVLANPTKP
ncbi:hypothetical protein PR003_g25494, partial [Phytophthora rubi]